MLRALGRARISRALRRHSKKAISSLLPKCKFHQKGRGRSAGGELPSITPFNCLLVDPFVRVPEGSKKGISIANVNGFSLHSPSLNINKGNHGNPYLFGCIFREDNSQGCPLTIPEAPKELFEEHIC